MRSSTKANTWHISTIGASLDGCWAHLSPRFKVWAELTSSTHGKNHSVIHKKGRRVSFILSDILNDSLRSWIQLGKGIEY